MTQARCGMRYIADKEEYIKFINYINECFFEDMQITEAFFGLELECDEEAGVYTQSILEYRGDIKNCPESFPAIVYFHLDDYEDRIGKVSVREFYYETVEQLGIKIFTYEKPNIKRCKWKLPPLEHLARKKCRCVCDGYCPDCEDYWGDGTYLGFDENTWADFLLKQLEN